MTRAFVIPVLNLSPHSPWNILTLLTDLEAVDGEVVCIFNNEAVFGGLRGHKRITRYAYNSQNAGVARSWNIGLNLTEADTVLVLNADVHIEPGCIETLTTAAQELDRAAIVGPQGSFLDFGTLSVMHYFDKQQAPQPTQTDDVSGFLFAVNRPRFVDAGLQFDPRYVPCFFEEWDIALQARRAGVSLWTVPVGGYEHIWGVSQNPRDVAFLGRSMNTMEAHAENRRRFVRKWARDVRFHPQILAEAGLA